MPAGVRCSSLINFQRNPEIGEISEKDSWREIEKDGEISEKDSWRDEEERCK